MNKIYSLFFVFFALHLVGCSEGDKVIIQDHVAYYANDTVEAKSLVIAVSGLQNIDTSEVAAPIVRHRFEPTYPRLASRLGVEGEIFIRAWVDTNGFVRMATILPDTDRIEAVDKTYLEDATLRAAMRWTFTPALYRGKPIPFATTITFQYKLIGGPIKFRSGKYDFNAIDFVANDTCALRIGYSAPISKVGESNNSGPEDTTDMTPPSIVKQVVPEYPNGAQLMGAEGQVLVKMWVSSKGKANYAVILKSTNPGFNTAALYAAVQTEFLPAKNGGKPVAVWVVMPYTFRFPGN